MGGAVSGGDIYGSFPELYLGNPLDADRGRLIPTTSVDEYFAEIALWFGVPAADLEIVLPNLHRFYAVGSATAPVGFLGAGSAAARRQRISHPPGRRPGRRGSSGRPSHPRP
jgi:uncharacterized protein (DUF1501 family)